MTPPERHAAVLEALNQQIEQKRASASEAVGWIREYRDREAVGLEGRRRILVRRAPVLCRHCPESRQHYVSAAAPMFTWPDEDWLDASAGVEER